MKVCHRCSHAVPSLLFFVFPVAGRRGQVFERRVKTPGVAGSSPSGSSGQGAGRARAERPLHAPRAALQRSAAYSCLERLQTRVLIFSFKLRLERAAETGQHLKSY